MFSFLKAGLFWCGMLLSFVAYGQAVPLGALPMQYNPSFAGEASGPRISSNVMLRTGRAYYGKGSGMYSSYDQFIPALRSGIGITAGYVSSARAFGATYIPGNNRYEYDYLSISDYHVSFAIAPKFSLKGKLTLSPSIDIAYSSQKLVQSDNKPVRVDLEELSNDDAIRSRAGLLLNTDKFYIGYSVHLFDLYNRRYKNDTINFNRSGRENGFTSYLQLGYTFRRSATSDFSFTPQLVFFIGTNSIFSLPDGPRRLWNYFGPVALNLNFRYKKFIWGLNNAGIHVGYQSDRAKIMLSNIIGLAGRDSPGYTANLSFRYVFKQEDR